MEIKGDVDLDIWFTYLANLSIRHYDCLSIFKKQVCTVTVKDKKAKLPNGFNRILAARVSGCQSGDNWGWDNLIYVEQNYLTDCGLTQCTDSNWWNANGWNLLGQETFEIQDGYIYIHQEPMRVVTDPDTGLLENVADPITSLTIAYLGLAIENNGLMKAYEVMERGVVCFIAARYWRRERDLAMYNTYNDEWKAQKGWVQGIQFQDNFRNTKRQVAEIASALIVDKGNWGGI